MTKLYLIVDVRSGEDYNTDEPYLLLVTKDENEAIEFFNKEIEEWEEGMENNTSNIDYSKYTGEHLYECTDYDGDTHRIMKLYTKIVD